jgi:glycosyltransferase involved in cell wall biosynthesis
MMHNQRFNYIITIHNKEDMIEQVLMSVLMCCRDNSYIYPVLDGCTDKTEEIVDKIIQTYANLPITKVHTPDVHELLSINAGLRAAYQDGDGFNIILQDDVLLADFFLERKVKSLYEWAGTRLGYVSFRMGANFTQDAASSDAIIPLQDFVENAYGHGLPEAQILFPGQFAYRSVPIKSPVCIPFYLVRSIGLLEERLAPYAHDDTEYSIRSMKAGFQNAVFAVRFYSELKWGGTRVIPHPKIGEFLKCNISKIREWHRDFIQEISSVVTKSDITSVPGCEEDGREHALNAWEDARSSLNSYTQLNQSNIKVNAKLLIKKLLRLITHEKA